MESNFFRLLAQELGAALQGCRVQKIYSPAPSVFSFELDGRAPARCLLLNCDRQRPLLCLSQEKPENPPRPDGLVMSLRRHLAGCRLLQAHSDWPGRRLAWRLSGPEQAFFCIDLRLGPQVLPALDESFDHEPAWPDLDQIRTDPDVWRHAQQVSPALRRLLTSLDPEAAAQALADVRAGAGGVCYGYEPAGSRDANSRLALAWRLPDSLRRGRDEMTFASATQAADWVAEAAIYAAVHQSRHQGELGALSAANRRTQRALDRLEAERQRLQTLIDGAQEAALIKSQLYAMDPRAKCSTLTLSDASGVHRTLTLDPRWCVAENMERLFRQAAKGKRGLPILEARRLTLERELEKLCSGHAPSSSPNKPPAPSARPRKARPEPALQRFRTDDGFLLLRGRNSKANHALVTRVARPFDLWFHAEDGPGAHVVLQREHPGQEVPARSMEQAAMLAGLRSWQAGSAKARVLCARVRDVRAVKGADPGSVRVDRVLDSFCVALDPDLEARLCC